MIKRVLYFEQSISKQNKYMTTSRYYTKITGVLCC